jgi:prepilin-type N-terminal cleavage/methylation domain-containing protein
MTAQIKRGFTLIELLIVMAILGVLAVVVLVAINPVQQLARTRDTGRKSSVTQLGHALQAYFTARSLYPAANTGWISTLSTSGELSTIPSQINYSVGTAALCTTAAMSGWCYANQANTTNAIIFAQLESQVEQSKCNGTNTWFVFSAEQGRAGIVCQTGVPAATGVPFTFTD